MPFALNEPVPLEVLKNILETIVYKDIARVSNLGIDESDKIAKVVYGANGVSWTPAAEAKAKMLESDPKFKDFATMMVKTHLSLSHDPALKGVPKGWTLPIQDVLIYSGAKFLCPVAGTISLMPGTSSNPAFRRIDVNTKTGKVKGLF